MEEEHVMHHANMSKAQCMKLMRGQTTQLNHEDIGHGLKLVVPHSTAKKMNSAKKRGKGIRVQLSPASIYHNATVNSDFKELLPASVVKRGQGFGQFVHSLGIPYRKSVNQLRNVGAQIANVALPAAASVAGNVVGDLTGNPLAGMAIGAVASKVVGQQAAKIKGKGLFRTLNKLGIKGVKGKLKGAAHQAIAEHSGAVTSHIANAAAQAVAQHTGSTKFANMASEAIHQAGAQAVSQAHDQIDGAGLFRFLHNHGLKGVKGKLKQAGHTLIDQAIPQVSNALGAAVGSQFGSAAGDMAAHIASTQGAAAAHQTVSGLGRKRVRGGARTKPFRVTEGGSFSVSGA